MKTATELRRLNGFEGDARLFELSESITYDYDYESRKDRSSTRFVIVSAVAAMFSGPETYIFPADEQGQVVHWGELEGSFKGSLDHAQALENAGYIVVKRAVSMLKEKL